MKTALLVLIVIGMPLFLTVGVTSADDIHCWLQHLGVL